MLTIALILLAFLIGGSAGRLRGTGLVTDFVARFGVWGGTVGVLVVVATLDLTCGLAGLILAGVGASFGYWGDYNLTLPENRTWKNFWKLSAMGCIRFAPLLLASFYVDLEWHVLPAVLAGFSFYPAYRLGVIAAPIKLPLLTSFSEWGEFFFWSTIYAALAAGFLLY